MIQSSEVKFKAQFLRLFGFCHLGFQVVRLFIQGFFLNTTVFSKSLDVR